MPEYVVRYSETVPELLADWENPCWNKAESLVLSFFRPEGTDHKPETVVQLLYSKKGISGIFRVDDRYIRSVHTKFMDPVYKDSCVEFFVKPKLDAGYFNFEFNCSGTMLCSYIRDPARTVNGFRDFKKISEEDASDILIYHSLPNIVEPEITQPLTWFLSFFTPFRILEKYVGPLGAVKGHIWNANFYKCGDETSHPHWGSWTPLPSKNFHMPEHFGKIIFE